MPKNDDKFDDILDSEVNGQDDGTDNAADDEKEREVREEESSDNTGYDDGTLEGRVSNSVGRGAVEGLIKNSVYEKYNIDSKAMKEFSRLTPTEMISSFSDSVRKDNQRLCQNLIGTAKIYIHRSFLSCRVC